MARIARALISVSDKTGIIEFAEAFYAHGVEILSTGGTARVLKEAGISVIDVATYTGFPEILDGRLKTLHPKIHGGLLGRRLDLKHQNEMAANAIGHIDIVVVNLYPFEATIANPACTFDEAIENIDIGGPAMLRSAAKNHADVAVVIDPSDYSSVIAEMDANKGLLSAATRFKLAQKAFAVTARYDSVIASYLSTFSNDRQLQNWPTYIGFSFKKVCDLRYGENPHQKAAFYRDAKSITEPSLVNARQLQGKELSYNNIMDADASIGIVQEFPEAKFAVCIVKHANPCGVALSDKSLTDAYAKAFACDSTSAFGGIIALSQVVDEEIALVISGVFYEVIIAPRFDQAALAILSKKKNLRLLEIVDLGKSHVQSGFCMRNVVGGVLLQERDVSSEKVLDAKVVTKRVPTDIEWKGLEFAWRICKHVKSNAIVYAAEDCTLGIGAGQMSRVDSSRIATMKVRSLSGQTHKDLVVASDAFFPFRDGIDAVADAGAMAVIQPGGSIRDDEVIAAADERGIAMVFTGVRHFRH